MLEERQHLLLNYFKTQSVDRTYMNKLRQTEYENISLKFSFHLIANILIFDLHKGAHA